MSSPLDERRCYAAVVDETGSRVEEVEGFRRSLPGGGFDTAWFWQVDATPVLPDAAGAPPTASSFPPPGGLKYGFISLPPHSGGRMQGQVSAGLRDHDEDTGMHATASLDLEFVVSGRVDLELPGGVTRTFGPGDSIVMAGAPHRWSNPYDETCVYVAVVVGASLSP